METDYVQIREVRYDLELLTSYPTNSFLKRIRKEGEDLRKKKAAEEAERSRCAHKEFWADITGK